MLTVNNLIGYGTESKHPRHSKRARRGRDDNSLCKCSVYLCTVQTKKHAKNIARNKRNKHYIER